MHVTNQIIKPAPDNFAGCLDMKIRYSVGDATSPSAADNRIIAHICNDQGAWGKGFVLALSRRWRTPGLAFKKWFSEQSDFELGSVQLVQVEPDTWVANMVAQHGLRAKKGVPPIRYDALKACLERVAVNAKALNATVHMPRIGCGLAGGEWSRIEPMIMDVLCRGGTAVTIYDLE